MYVGLCVYKLWNILFFPQVKHLHICHFFTFQDIGGAQAPFTHSTLVMGMYRHYFIFQIISRHIGRANNIPIISSA